MNSSFCYFYSMILRILTFILLFAISVFAQNANELSNKYSLAQSYEQAGDLENALKLYEEIHQKDPENIQFVNSLNRMYVQLKNYAASVDLCIRRKDPFYNAVQKIGKNAKKD